MSGGSLGSRKAAAMVAALIAFFFCSDACACTNLAAAIAARDVAFTFGAATPIAIEDRFDYIRVNHGQVRS